MNFILYTDDLLTATSRNLLPGKAASKVMANVGGHRYKTRNYGVAEERRCVQDWLQNYFVRYYHAHVHMMGSSSTNSNQIQTCH